MKHTVYPPLHYTANYTLNSMVGYFQTVAFNFSLHAIFTVAFTILLDIEHKGNYQLLF
jgi:hypothetical protein